MYGVVMNDKLIQLLHDITQMDYMVQFASDFEGMIRIEFRKEYDEAYYSHRHIGYPDCDNETLTKFVVEYLEVFKKEAENGVRNTR
jgi:hypothetical protein